MTGLPMCERSDVTISSLQAWRQIDRSKISEVLCLSLPFRPVRCTQVETGPPPFYRQQQKLTKINGDGEYALQKCVSGAP